jgi:hypothetical protein
VYFRPLRQEAFVSSISRLIIGAVIASISWSAQAALPLIQPTQQVIPPSSDYSGSRPWGYGADVDMYGNVAIVGAPNGNNYAGRADIFTRDSSGHWKSTASLVASDSDGAFGAHVALLEGKAVVASRTAIYLFVKQSNGQWQQKDKRTFKNASEVRDLDWQGNLLVVGVFGTGYPNVTTPDYAFAYDTSDTNTLRKIARFVPAAIVKSDWMNGGFGARVAVYGSTVVATGPDGNNGPGAAYVYNCSATSCTQTQKLVPIDGTGDGFGSAVDMNGTYLVIGALLTDYSAGQGDTARTGSAYVYRRSGKAWTLVQTLHPTSDEVTHYESFGTDVTIQGSRLVVSAPYGTEGLVFDYALEGSQWSARALMKSPLSGFGASTSLIGNYAIIGTPFPGNPNTSSEVDFYTLP